MTITLIKPKLEAKVEGLGEVYRADIPFDQALESLRGFGIGNPISTRDLAYARIKKGEDSSLSRDGCYTRAGFLYLKNEPYLLALNSPLLDLKLASQAVRANINNEYFSTDRAVYNKYRQIAESERNKEPEEKSVLILPKRENYEIPTSEFNGHKETRFLFKDQAENYGEFLRDNRKRKIEGVSFWLVDKEYVDSQEGTLLTQLWLHCLGGGSDLGGDDGSLGYVLSVRGVFKKTN